MSTLYGNKPPQPGTTRIVRSVLDVEIISDPNQDNIEEDR